MFLRVGLGNLPVCSNGLPGSGCRSGNALVDFFDPRITTSDWAADAYGSALGVPQVQDWFQPPAPKAPQTAEQLMTWSPADSAMTPNDWAAWVEQNRARLQAASPGAGPEANTLGPVLLGMLVIGAAYAAWQGRR